MSRRGTFWLKRHIRSRDETQNDSALARPGVLLDRLVGRPTLAGPLASMTPQKACIAVLWQSSRGGERRCPFRAIPGRAEGTNYDLEPAPSWHTSFVRFGCEVDVRALAPMTGPLLSNIEARFVQSDRVFL